MKQCSGCRLAKPAAEFGKDRSRTDGLQRTCKACYAEYRKANRERLTASNRAYVERNKDRIDAYQRQYRVENASRIVERTCRWQRENAAKVNATHCARYHANIDRARAVSRSRAALRRARTRGAYVEHVDALVVLERDDGVCGICAHDVDPFDFHVDHIVPLAAGGEHSYDNSQVAHPFCNQSKGAKVLTEGAMTYRNSFQ